MARAWFATGFSGWPPAVPLCLEVTEQRVPIGGVWLVVVGILI
jgi:hypothetical protein